MYSGASTFVEGVDNAFVFIIGISLIFLIGISFTLLYFVIKYNKNKNPKSSYIEGSIKLEIIWTIIPTILVLGMFYYGWVGFTPMRKPPKNAMEINTVARMWSWSFNYPNGRSTDTLYIPVNKAVKLNLKAEDVVHSLYIPAFRVKEDVVPGKDNYMWFESRKVGTYDLFCTEYCGLRHSYMYTAVVVLPDSVFNEWYNDTAFVRPGLKAGEEVVAELQGFSLIKKNGCIACHSLDGTKIVGPSFLGMYGKNTNIQTKGVKKSVIIDTDYIKNSIYEPDADIVEGFSYGQMQSYKKQITEEEITLIVEYMKTLKGGN